jgi:hypothetical protein
LSRANPPWNHDDSFGKMAQSTKRQRKSLPLVDGLIKDLPIASLDMLLNLDIHRLSLPIVTTDLWETMTANLDKAGYQGGKDRAAWQWNSLRELRDENENLEDWLSSVSDVAEKMGASGIINAFACVNAGSNTSRETHVDRFSGVATHRLLSYIVNQACDSVLVITIAEQFHQVVIPSGTAILVPEAVLALPHMHGTADVNFVFIAELFIAGGVDLSLLTITSAAQPPLLFDSFATALSAEQPTDFFLGSPSRFHGFGPPTREESMRYLAISALLRTKGDRTYGSKKAAREAVRGMTPSEVADLASQRGRELAAASLLMSRPGDKLTYSMALDRVRALSSSEVADLASQRMIELGKKSISGLLLHVLCMMFAHFSLQCF